MKKKEKQAKPEKPKKVKEEAGTLSDPPLDKDAPKP